MDTTAQQNKKQKEKKFGDFFINQFNQRYNSSYVTQNNDKESIKDGDIDVYAIAENQETLNLQIKTGEPLLEAFRGTRKKYGSGGFGITTIYEDHYKQIINEAEQKYPSSKGNLILLICEKLQPGFDKEYTKLLSKQIGYTGFMGVYLVKLPFSDAKHPYEGQVVAIKDIFGNHGETF